MCGIGGYIGPKDSVDVLVEGIGSATVRVSERLVARIESSGSVYYIGNPEVEATINGTGSVEQIGR